MANAWLVIAVAEKNAALPRELIAVFAAKNFRQTCEKFLPPLSPFPIAGVAQGKSNGLLRCQLGHDVSCPYSIIAESAAEVWTFWTAFWTILGMSKRTED